MSKSKIFKALALVLSCQMVLSGCGIKQYFKDPDSKYVLKYINDDELENDIYYVKVGAKFAMTHIPGGSYQNDPNVAGRGGDVKEVFWTMKDESLIPTLYADDFIAYKSELPDLPEVEMVRFRAEGFTQGIFNMTPDDDGYFDFKVKENTVPESDANTVLKKAESNDIRVVSSDTKKTDPDMITASGVFKGSKEAADRSLSFYAGTSYQSAKLKADTRMYSYFETYNLGKGTTTRRSYIRYDMPKEAKSGYYMIRGGGVFRYYDFKRGEGDEATADMNVPFYANETEQLAIYSQQFSVDVPSTTDNLEFYVSYKEEDTEEDGVSCTLTSPDGTAYSMDASNGNAYASVKTAIGGTWTISVYPRNLEILDVGVNSSALSSTATIDKQAYNLENDMPNMQFGASYDGDGEIWGTVTYEDGSVMDLINDPDNHVIQVTYPYAVAGKYVVEVYHYEDTKVNEFYQRHDQSMQEEEIITVEEE